METAIVVGEVLACVFVGVKAYHRWTPMRNRLLTLEPVTAQWLSPRGEDQ